jgi:hypothetical protein
MYMMIPFEATSVGRKVMEVEDIGVGLMISTWWDRGRQVLGRPPHPGLAVDGWPHSESLA